MDFVVGSIHMTILFAMQGVMRSMRVVPGSGSLGLVQRIHKYKIFALGADKHTHLQKPEEDQNGCLRSPG